MRNTVNILFFSGVLFLGGCSQIVFSRVQSIPDGVAESAEELVTKLEALKKGTPTAAVLKALNINEKTPEVGDLVSAIKKQEFYYGNVQVEGSLEDIEEWRQILSDTDIKTIRFKDMANRLGKIRPISITLVEEGPDLVAYLVFYQDKFVEVIKPANFYKKTQRTVYVTDLLKDAARRGIREIGR